MCYFLFICYISVSWVSEILSEVKSAYLVKNSLIVFQNALLLAKLVFKKDFLFLLIKLLQKFLALFIAKKFYLNGHLGYLFLFLDLFIIASKSILKQKQPSSFSHRTIIPDFGVSTVISNPADTLRGCAKLAFARPF